MYVCQTQRKKRLKILFKAARKLYGKKKEDKKVHFKKRLLTSKHRTLLLKKDGETLFKALLTRNKIQRFLLTLVLQAVD